MTTPSPRRTSRHSSTNLGFRSASAGTTEGHYLCGLGLLTPHDVHHGLAPKRLRARFDVHVAAHKLHPERFIHGIPRPQELPGAVWVNNPNEPLKAAL